MTTDDASQSIEYLTRGNITVRRTAEPVPPDTAIDPLIDELDDARGMLLSSTFEFPDRYSRWDVGFASPPLAVSAVDRTFRIEALRRKGAPLLAAIKRALRTTRPSEVSKDEGAALSGQVATSSAVVPEERRSREPTIFSVLRSIIGLFGSDADRISVSTAPSATTSRSSSSPSRSGTQRPPRQRDLVLYLPDELMVVDHRRETRVAPSLRVRCRRRSDATPQGLPRGCATPRPHRRRARTCERPPRERSRARRIRRHGARRARGVPARRSLRGGRRARPSPRRRASPSDDLPPPAQPQPRALRLSHEPRRRRVPRRRLAGDVRARRRRPRRDVPDRGHDRARQGRVRATPTRSCGCSRPRRTNPSSPCARTSTATTSRASASRHRARHRAAARSSSTRGSSIPSTTSRGGCARTSTPSTHSCATPGRSP